MLLNHARLHRRHLPTTALRHDPRALLLAAILWLPLMPSQAQEASDASSAVTLLPQDSVVGVDLNAVQLAKDKAAALERAKALAAARGLSEPVKSIPEIDLIAREVLHDLYAIPTRFDAAEAGWRVRSDHVPELFAQRVIARLMRAGFSSAPRCAGEEWSGSHGESRVALRIDKRWLNVLVLTAGAPCPH
jgi:hypothetical protein